MRSRKASGLGANSAHEAPRGDLLGRRIGAEAISRRPLNQHRARRGRQCVGHVVVHEHGFAAVAADGKPRGFFSKQINAINTLPRRENPSPVEASDGRKQCLP